jgi:acetyl-CoA acyltransferase 1
MSERLSAVMGHLNPTIVAGRADLLKKNPDDIVSRRCKLNSLAHVLQVITLAIRTALTKARKGGLKDTPLDDLLIAILTVLPHLTPSPQYRTDGPIRRYEKNPILTQS